MENPESKTKRSETVRGTPSNTLRFEFEIENGPSAAEQQSSYQCASVRVDVRATPRRQPTGRRATDDDEEKKSSRDDVDDATALSYTLRTTATATTLYRFPFHCSAFPRLVRAIYMS